MKTEVTRLAQPPSIDARWDKEPWTRIRPETLTLHMGQKPEHMPLTQARLAYDADAIYVIFRVEDRYIRAAVQEHHGPVCHDSCVEFFFTPGLDLSVGYFNVELNCGGTLYFDFNAPGKPGVEIARADCDTMKIAHSMPRVVNPEATEPATWTIEYSLPVRMLEKYCPVVRPGPGARWRANLYKCADKTSHPHWLTWAFVNFPRPRFHLPEFFGTLEFK